MDHKSDHSHHSGHSHEDHGTGASSLRLERALSTLKEAGHRITAPRRALLDVLIQEHGPFSADELHRRLPEGLCDPVTVYRSIGVMEESDLVRRCDFGDGTYRY